MSLRRSCASPISASPRFLSVLVLSVPAFGTAIAVGLVSLVGCAPSTPNRDPRWGTQHSASAPGQPVTGTAAPTTPPASQPSPQPAGDIDFSRLLLEAADLTDADDTFALRSSTINPSGVPGGSALFVNAPDTRAISDTIAVFPDAATATATLRGELSAVDTVVAGGSPQPSPVGTDGMIVKGTSPDGAKAVTLLLYTQGPAMVRLRFDSAPGDPASDRFVTSIGKMQQIALRVGLPTSE